MFEIAQTHRPSAGRSRFTTLLLGTSLLLCFSLPAMSQDIPGGGYEAGAAQARGEAGPTQPGERIFHIMTVHLDAKTNVNGDGGHPPEPFPQSAAGSSGGLIVRPPDEKGNWSIRSFVFQPSQVVVMEGDTVVINFVGVQGPSHSISIEGQDEQISLKRGEVKTVRLLADQAGTIRFVSVGREPTMHGSILVLPRD
jgi:plastocyanin